MTATAPATEKITLHSIARAAYVEAKGNIADAKAAIREALAKPGVAEALTNDILTAIVNQMAHAQATAHRARIVKAAPLPGRASVIALATGLDNAMLAWPVNGKELRNATRDDLAIAINKYDAASASARRTANWLTHILQALPADKTVGEALSEERVTELWNTMEKVNENA